MEFQIKKAIEECSGDKFLKRNFETILACLETLRRESQSISYVRKVINRVRRVYNLYLHLPPEILSEIFLFLPFEDLLESRAVFLVCKDWSYEVNNYLPFWSQVLERRFGIVLNRRRRDIVYLVEDIRKYLLLRHTLEKHNNLQSFPKKQQQQQQEEDNLGEEHFFEYSNSRMEDLLLLNIENARSQDDGVQSYVFNCDYILWLQNLDFCQISLMASSEKFSRVENRVVISVYITVDGRSFAKMKITLNYHKVLFFEETFEYLEKIGLMKHLLEKGVISSPIIQEEQLKGGLRAFSKFKDPILLRLMFVFLGLFEVVSNTRVGSKQHSWTIRKYLLSDVFSTSSTWLSRDHFYIKTRGFREYLLQEYINRKKGGFSNSYSNFLNEF